MTIVTATTIAMNFIPQADKYDNDNDALKSVQKRHTRLYTLTEPLQGPGPTRTSHNKGKARVLFFITSTQGQGPLVNSSAHIV